MKSKRKSYRPTRVSDEAESAGTALDGGWAWMVCLGSHLVQILCPGYIASLGIFYIEWKEYFDSSATASSWVVSMPWLVGCPLCLVSGFLAPRFGIRRVAVLGSVVNGIATILGSFANDMWQLYLCGAMSGVATMILSPTMIILAQYFKKRYALANGICLLGVCVGQMIFPPLIRVLVASYGWRGAMFIIGALQMNGVVACALYRPLKVKPDQDQLGNRDIAMEVLHNGETTGTETDITTVPQNRPAQNQGNSYLKYSASVKLFTNIPLMLSLLLICLYAMGWMINIAHLPARSKEAGWSDDQNAALLTVFGIVAFATRGSHGWFVDQEYIGIFKLQLTVLFCASLVTFLNPVSDSYVFLVGYTALLGACLGIASPMIIIIVKGLASDSQMPTTFGLILATFSLANGIGPLIAGKVFDATRNYVATFLCAGALFLAAFLVLILVIITRRHERDRRLKINMPAVEDVAKPRSLSMI